MESLAQDLRQFVIEWNNRFPIDKWWRDRYKIPFGSQQHLEANQIDILFEYIENSVFEEHSIQVLENIKKTEMLKKGIWLSERDDPEEVSDELFDKIVI